MTTVKLEKMPKKRLDVASESKEIQLLEDIAKWTRLQGKQYAKKIVESLLNTEEKKLVYHFSDGKSSPEIAKITKVHPTTVRGYWKSWTAEGIMELHPEYKRRCKRVFSLEELGLEAPEAKHDRENATEKIKSEGEQNEH